MAGTLTLNPAFNIKGEGISPFLMTPACLPRTGLSPQHVVDGVVVPGCGLGLRGEGFWGFGGLGVRGLGFLVGRH